jgi:hypothetical protein
MLNCAAYKGYLRFYVKSGLGGGFQSVGGGTTHGVWIPSSGPFGSFCILVKDPGFDDPPVFAPPAFSPDVYRVAVAATLLGEWQRVRATASHIPIVS